MFFNPAYPPANGTATGSAKSVPDTSGNPAQPGDVDAVNGSDVSKLGQAAGARVG